MSFPKFLAGLTFCLFAGIAVAGWWKQEQPTLDPVVLPASEVVLETTVRAAIPDRARVNPSVAASSEVSPVVPTVSVSLPQDVNRIDELFTTTGSKLPIVQTVAYKSQVPWLKGRQAWLSDYASHYHTSRHFMARSLNGQPDYTKQDVTEGARFNVWHPEARIQFHLVIDMSLCKLWLYYQDLATGQRELLKSYTVGLGRPDASTQSGLLTPLGAYVLGDKVAIFGPKSTGMHQGHKTQMIRVFGTRWIPFERALASSSLPAKGYGLHGVPWKENEKGELAEDTTSLGSYASDGCVRLATCDIEEIFAIIISKPTVVELVAHFQEATFPVVKPTS